MEFEGKEYSEELLEELKKTYLTCVNFSKFPVLKTFGMNRNTAERLLEILVPRPSLKTADDVWDVYYVYPTIPELRRVIRTKEPTTYILDTVITEKALVDMYTTQNLLMEEIMQEMRLPPVITQEAVIGYIKRHKIRRRPETLGLNNSKTMNKLYNDPIRRKEADEKRAKTNLERYGFPYGLQSEEVKDRGIQTNYERYGVPYAMQSEDIKGKARETSYERYGATYQAQADAIFSPTPYVDSLERSIEVLETPESLQKFLNEHFPERVTFTLHEIARITGRSYASVRGRVNTSLGFISPSDQGHLPEQIQNFLEELGYVSGTDFIINDRTVLKPQEIDFYFPKQKVGIEVNDIDTHNSTHNYYGGPVKSKNYHMEKSRRAKEQGIRLIHAWEHYVNDPQQYEVLKNAIKHALGISKYRVYARNTYVKEVPNKSLKDFFNTNNIQGFRGAKTAYALFDKKTDEVLMAYSVGASHFSHNKYDMELIRGASKLDTTIVGGASKLWKFIIDNNPEVNSIVYYIDRNLYSGSSISTLEGNLELFSTQVGFWNYFVETEEMKNRQPAKHKEIKELVDQGKVWEVYNAGTETYVWTRS